MLDKLKHAEKLNPEQRVMRTLTTMQRDFRLSELPRHIECFDNSNIQGTNPVASCVVFKNAKPSKRDYRHFNIKTVVGPDDFASMKEVLTRRYTRLVNEGEPLPQLVIVDGGKGQLSAAVEAFDAMGLRGKIALVGIAKRLEEIFFPTRFRFTSTKTANRCVWCNTCATRRTDLVSHTIATAAARDRRIQCSTISKELEVFHVKH